MIGKLIVHGETRQEAINRLSRSLEEFIIDGIKTTIPLQRSLLAKEEFVDGDYTIKSLEAWLEEKSLKKI